MEPDRKYSTAIIFGILDFDEFKVLNVHDKDFIRLMLSCEYVDLTDGGKSLEKLYEIFPFGSTKDNIDNLIYEIPEE